MVRGMCVRFLAATVRDRSTARDRSCVHASVGAVETRSVRELLRMRKCERSERSERS